MADRILANPHQEPAVDPQSAEFRDLIRGQLAAGQDEEALAGQVAAFLEAQRQLRIQRWNAQEEEDRRAQEERDEAL